MRTDEESVISYLIKARNEKGLSQQKIAEAIGKHKKTIQNWESGIGSPSIGDLFAWIHALDENEMKYMLLYKYGEKALDPVDDIDQKRERLHEFIDSFLTEPEIDILYYLFQACMDLLYMLIFKKSVPTCHLLCSHDTSPATSFASIMIWLR